MSGARDTTLHAQPAPARSLDPRLRWTQITDAPLAGMALAREAGWILVWDDAHNMQVLDLGGERRAAKRVPKPILLAAMSDDGSQIVATSHEGDIWWLGRELDLRVQKAGTKNAIGIAVSPDGRYMALSLSDSHTRIYDVYGRLVSDFVTQRPLKHLQFMAGRAVLAAAAEYGLAGCYELDGEPRWQDALWSSTGHLTTSGDGFAILVCCFGHGLQRYALDGTNEGAYHLGGSVARASIDYDGKLFAASTLEGEVLIVNAVGHVLWRQQLTKPARAVLLDGPGRTLVCGQETGEFSVFDLVAAPAVARPGAAEPAGAAGRPAPALSAAASAATAETRVPESQLRDPVWKTTLFESEAQAETAVLALVHDPVRIVVFTNRRRFEVLDAAGERMHVSDMLSGVGRYLDADGGLVLAATDREMALYDVARNASTRFPDHLVQISHMRIDTAAGHIVTVEERDRLSRFDLGGRRRWVANLDRPVEALAIGRAATSAVTTEDGRLIVFDGDQHRLGEFATRPAESLALVQLGARWITLAGKSQVVRAHRVDGSVEWETPIPTEAWRLERVANHVIARAMSGRSYVLSARGELVLDTSELPYEAQLFATPAGAPRAVFWRAGNLMITDWTGHVAWRHLVPDPPGVIVAGFAGVACAVGRDLAFFPA